MNHLDIIKQIMPCNTEKPYVFISYSSYDRDVVWPDVLKFQQLGYNVWLDEKNLDKTKASWKLDAIKAIEDIFCELVVFYVSSSSLVSKACYDELSSTMGETAIAYHLDPVKFIAIDVENVGNIGAFTRKLHQSVRMDQGLSKEEKEERFSVLYRFMKDFFDSNNEKVRVHPKNELNRKMDYYEEIIASFPDLTKNGVKAEQEEKETLSLEELSKINQRAHKLYNDGNTEESFSMFLKAAEAEHVPSINMVAYLYYTESTKQDYDKAFYWYEKSALSGDAYGQHGLGNCYLNGNGVEKNLKKAFYWYQKSADQKSHPGMYMVGYCYYYGYGVEKDYVKAFEWYEKAAKEGSTSGLEGMAFCYVYGYGVEKNVFLAFDFFLKAKKQGSQLAQGMMDKIKKENPDLFFVE